MKLKSSFWAILSLSLLLIFFYLQSYDTMINISFGEYSISTHSTFLCLVALIAIVLFLTLVRLVILPFKVLEGLIDKIKIKKEKDLFKYLLQASEFTLLNDTAKAQKTIQNLLNNNNNLPIEFENYLRLLFIKLDVSFNTKLHYLQKLLNDSSKFKFFIAKDLSRLALNEKAYHYSLEFALIALEINNQDPELLELLVEIYATLESWKKMEETIHILYNIDKDVFITMKERFSNYYLKAAKHFIGLGQMPDSVFYLKKCLEYKPDSFKCIEIISNIYLETKELNLKSIIETAFVINPSFELFKIYYKNYKNYLLTEEIYNNLISPINKQQHIGLVIAIAYFLNMKQELDNVVLPII
jgi:hypothetical protein